MSPFQQSPDLGTGQQTPITTPQIAPTAPGFEGFFSSFLCKLCINVNDFLILKILKFTKRKYIKFFHLLIFLSRISPASRQAAGKLRDSHAHSTQAASPSSRPSSWAAPAPLGTPAQHIPLLCSQISVPLPASIKPPRGGNTLLTHQLDLGVMGSSGVQYGVQWGLGLWPGPKWCSDPVNCL